MQGEHHESQIPISAEVADLMDGYLEDASTRRNAAVGRMPDSRRRPVDYFVLYCQTHTDLNIEARARRAVIGPSPGSSVNSPRARDGAQCRGRSFRDQPNNIRINGPRGDGDGPAPSPPYC